MIARRSGALAAFVLTALSAGTAAAHGGGQLDEHNAAAAWNLTPDIAIPTALVVAAYLAGAIRRRHSAAAPPWWRHAMFAFGLGSVFLALQSPIDPIAERLFFVHQVQHLLLRMTGPMLIALSWPQAQMAAGLPARLKGGALAPVVRNGAAKTTFRFLVHPVIATALFVLVLYFWEIPRYHDLAVMDDGVHYAMHATMLVAGLLFWWRIFDRRPPPAAADLDDEPARRSIFGGRRGARGLGYGVRLMMLWIAILSNILLGSFTALKTTVLYPAYDAVGRMFGYAAIVDERIGGVIIWIPSSMMCLIAILIVIHLWGLHENRQAERHAARSGSNSAALLYPATAAALIEQTRSKNRVMALGFVFFAATVFITAILVAIFYLQAGHLVATAG